ncbi:hypothetical protein ACR5KS_03575 [Leucobacter sp. W1153]|uniref:hypothetical protein n=1 Tax=Leucobacter sp. W1153 TaxID=3439064 RepID=UPI003F300DE4
MKLCTEEHCTSTVLAKQLCAKHYFRRRRGYIEKYLDHLPKGYWSDVPVAGTGPFGAVITCQTCKEQLGPVHDPTSAALTIHAHQQRNHARRAA